MINLIPVSPEWGLPATAGGTAYNDSRVGAYEWPSAEPLVPSVIRNIKKRPILSRRIPNSRSCYSAGRMSEGRKVGVVLFQLGSPDSADAVEPFLYNLFRDPDIIDFPFARLAREPLARLVANRRANKVPSPYAPLPEHFGSSLGCSAPPNEVTPRPAVA